jgi:hypothetical protein
MLLTFVIGSSFLRKLFRLIFSAGETGIDRCFVIAIRDADRLRTPIIAG